MTQTVDNILASLPLGPYDPFTMTNTPPRLEDLDFSFMYDSSDLSSYQNSPLSTQELMDSILCPFSGATPSDPSIPSNTPLSHFNHLPHTTPPGASTSGINIADPNLSNLLTGVLTGLEELEEGSHQTSQPLSHFNHLLPAILPGAITSGINMADLNLSDPLTGAITGQEELEEGPRRTSRRHVPSTREQVLNAIGSSGARVRPPVSVDKENNKRRKADAAGAGLQSRK